MKKILVLLAVALLARPMAAQAIAVWAFDQVSGNVQITLSGSVNLTGSNYNVVNLNCIQSPDAITVQADSGNVAAGGGPCDGYNFDDYSLNFGTFDNAAVPALSYSGDLFWATPALGRVAVPHGYVFGTALSGSATISGSFSSLGLIPGDYTWMLPGDSIVFRIGNAPSVPEPGTFALLSLGIAGLGLSRRRKPH